jgi:pimeloyl-ACP methyl ester carboxylesterase
MEVRRKSTRVILPFLFMVILCGLCSVSVFAQRFERKAGVYRTISPLRHKQTVSISGKDTALYEAVIQEGPLAINRFTMHAAYPSRDGRLIKNTAQRYLLLIPGGGSNFDFFWHESQPSIVSELTARGYVVYGYSPRTKGLSCESQDCSDAKYWNSDLYVSDIEWITTYILKHHKRKPIVGGYSLGSLLSYRLLGRESHEYAGAILLEGFFSPPTPENMEPLRQLCLSTRQALSDGTILDVQSPAMLKQMVQLAETNPQGASPFQAGLTNEQFFIAGITTPQSPPASLTPNYQIAAGNFEMGLQHSSLERAYALVKGLNDNDSNALNADLYCAFAGELNDINRFTDGIERYTGPIFMVGGGLSFGPYMEYPGRNFGSPEWRITRWIEPNFGHMDFAGSTSSIQNLVERLDTWMRTSRWIYDQ